MKRAKKILCATLALIMTLSLTVMPAFADDPVEEPETQTLLKREITIMPVLEQVTGKYDGSTYAALTADIPNLTITAVLSPVTGADSTFVGTNSQGEVVVDLTSSFTSANTGIMPTDTTGYTKTYGFPVASGTEGATDDYTLTQNFDLTAILAAIKAAKGTAKGEYWYWMTSTPSGDASIDTTDVAKNALSFIQSGYSDPQKFLVKITVMTDPYTNEFIISQVVAYDKDGTKKYIDEGGDQPTLEIKTPTVYAPLLVKNHVYGEGADNQTFTYYINIPEGGDNIVLTEGQTFTATITRANGQTEEKILYVKGDAEYILEKPGEADELGDPSNEFTLASGDQIKVEVPAGMIYGVIQESKENYSTKHEYYSKNGSTVTSDVIPKGDSTSTFISEALVEKWNETANVGCTTITTSETPHLAAGLSVTNSTAGITTSQYLHKGTIGDTENDVYYHNVWAYQPLEGITMDIMPYAMVMAAALALAVLMIIKKRTSSR